MQTETASMKFLEKRQHKRVSDALALRVENAQAAMGHAPLDEQPTHVVNFSCGGLCFLHESKLAKDELLLLTMRLGPEHTTVSVRAQVISSEDSPRASGNKKFTSRVKFVDVDKKADDLLLQHLNYVLEQTSKHRKEYHYKASA